MKKAIILIMDSFGIGATDDAEKFGDAGANTLGHIAEFCHKQRLEPLQLPNLARLGLYHAARESSGDFPMGCNTDVEIVAAYGHAEELSTGKDTPSGHWEMAGVPVLFDWGYFSEANNSFPASLLDTLIQRAKLPGVLGNCHASGTEILVELGEEHMRTGKPIVYTSADSVFQIACHEQSFGLEKLLELCAIARELVNEFNIGRVIARPFIGDNKDNFKRTGNRRDLAVLPPAPTVLDKLVDSGGEVISIGKIADIFAHQGISQKFKADGNAALFDTTLEAMQSAPERSIIFSNFVDFDSVYGHRRDVPGYAAALEYFDKRLPELIEQLEDDDLLIISADHGCDPSWPGTDHTREHIPVLVYSKTVAPGSLGKRKTFADIGQSLASYFHLPAMDYGKSFL
ncbi:MAG: phosphopentomutase [Gammaproteobacteria bacterium]|jgi:phosphopentomutase|nr:phosphopentomutase [Gammaproteobacteria bacterium]